MKIVFNFPLFKKLYLSSKLLIVFNHITLLLSFSFFFSFFTAFWRFSPTVHPPVAEDFVLSFFFLVLTHARLFRLSVRGKGFILSQLLVVLLKKLQHNKVSPLTLSRSYIEHTLRTYSTRRYKKKNALKISSYIILR